MKKQNIIILSIFVLVMVIFFCIRYYNNNKEDEEVDLEEKEEVTLEEKKDFYTVYVTGEVYRADTYFIPYNWTVGMLFDLVGIKASADISNFNLAEKVVDGKVYHVPKKYENKEIEGQLIDINHASKEELMKLPGIGEVIALRIISYRQKTPFLSIEEIKNVSGIGDAVYEKIKNYITV